MRRRQFLTLVGGGAASWPLAVRAQQTQKVPIVGVLDLGRATAEEGLRSGLRDLGYVEGKSIVIISRYAEGQQERLPGLVAEMLRLGVDVFASASTQAVQMIRQVNPTVPIVMTATSDPVGSGLVRSLSRPGGSTTGMTLLSTDAVGKRLELLKEIIPGLGRIAVLALRNHPPTTLLKRESEAAATALRIELTFLEVEPNEFDSAFAIMSRSKADAVTVQSATTFNLHLRRIAELALNSRLPAIHELRQFVAAGGMMSYGPNTLELGRRAAGYVDRILKGTRPGDLPVEQPTKFDLVVNLKTANSLGLKIPESFLLRADQVIE